MTDKQEGFKNGYWGWDDLSNSLIFISGDIKAVNVQVELASVASESTSKRFYCDVVFKDNLDATEQAKFRRYFRRKVKIIEPDVVTIQDLKDIALYYSVPQYLLSEFISYFHTEKIDKFLRSLIVYFQYYFQIWDNMVIRRKEAETRLRQPLVTLIENEVRDNLSDLRCIVARNYSFLILGLGDVKKFYHMKNESLSLSEKERHLFETLMSVAVRVVWIALNRKYLTLIEMEMGRLFRTNIFNRVIHRGLRIGAFEPIPEEERVLLGSAFVKERTLLHRSPAIQELIYGEQDYRLLGTCILDFKSGDKFLEYLEAVYAAPEEMLFDKEVGAGIMGAPRGDFDSILMPKKALTKKEVFTPTKIPEFKLPKKCDPKTIEVREHLPNDSCQYKQTDQTIKARINQHKIWRKYVELNGEIEELKAKSKGTSGSSSENGNEESSSEGSESNFNETSDNKDSA